MLLPELRISPDLLTFALWQLLTVTICIIFTFYSSRARLRMWCPPIDFRVNMIDPFR